MGEGTHTTSSTRYHGDHAIEQLFRTHPVVIPPGLLARNLHYLDGIVLI